jgi:hypothetical protein
MRHFFSDLIEAWLAPDERVRRVLTAARISREIGI